MREIWISWRYYHHFRISINGVRIDDRIYWTLWYSTRLWFTVSIVKVIVILWSTVSRPVCCGVKPSSGVQNQIFIALRRLRVYWCGVPSLTRGLVCRLQLLLSLVSKVILKVRVLRDSWPYFTISDSRLPQPGRPGHRIYIPHDQGDLVIPPDTGFPFRHLLRFVRLRWRYSNSPSRGARYGPHRKHRFYYCCGNMFACGAVIQ
jgi:hypothetical protein